MSIVETKENLWTLNEFAGQTIRMRNSDGYFNGKDMCKIKKGKLMGDYLRNTQAQEFVEELKKEVDGMLHQPLIEIINTGPNENRGTWIHPKVAIHLAMWISPTFSVKVIDWVDRFLRGDITLVKDIIDRHDHINNTQSEIFITTMNNQVEDHKQQIEEYKAHIQSLEKIKNDMKTQIDKLNEFRCKYCNRLYSNTAGLSRHLNNNCTDKEMRKYSLLLDFNKFKSYIELLLEYDLDEMELKTKNFDSENPTLVIKVNKRAPYTYGIKYNESRWRAVAMLQTKFNIPINELLDINSKKIINDNRNKLEAIHTNIKSDYEEFLVNEFKEKMNPSE